MDVKRKPWERRKSKNNEATPHDENNLKAPNSYSYKHCPLRKRGDIRLLTIQGGKAGQRIGCTLSTYPLRSLTDLPMYEALSYHWGDPGNSVTIDIYASESFPKVLPVTPNLHSALERLRLPDEPRVLWIDAICINQGDTSERNQQVSYMAEVYQKADHVCIWLGPADAQSDMALDFISRVINLNDFDRLVTDTTAARDWAALTSLMKRKWFNRRWVIQEIALAREATLYCGGADVKWSDFAVAVSLFEAAEIKGRTVTKSIRASSHFDHASDFLGEIKSLGATRLVNATGNLFRKSHTGQVVERLLTLDVLVSSLSVFEASNAHDTIYAILALAKDTYVTAKVDEKLEHPSHGVIEEEASVDTEPTQPILSALQTRLAHQLIENIHDIQDKKRITIDYGKPFFVVCQDFISFTVGNSKSLDIICRPWAPDDGFDNQNPPSWLLTMSGSTFGVRDDGSQGRKNADSLVGTPGVSQRNYSASGSMEVSPSWCFGSDEKARSMNVEGFVVDEIDEVMAESMLGLIPHDWLEAGGWIDKSAWPPEPFWRTLVGNRAANGLNPPAFYIRACKGALSKARPNHHIDTALLIRESKSEIIAEFARRVQEVIWGRKLVTTKNNDLGLASVKVRKGDIVCILYGCSVPVVLRRLGVKVSHKVTDEINDEINDKIMHATENGQREGPTKAQIEFSNFTNECYLHGAAGGYFEFLGECYVHGIMGGEAFEVARQRSRDKKIKKQVFELR